METTQTDEFAAARAEKRQPICVHCGELLDTVCETQIVDISWQWNDVTGKYEKDDSGGDSCKPYCDNCGVHDYDFTGGETSDFIDY